MAFQKFKMLIKQQQHRKTKQQRLSNQHSINVGPTLLALFMLASVASAASSNWFLNSIAPTQNGVSLKENLEWRLMSSQSIKEGDCVRFFFQNPYLGDAPETYKSFDLSNPYSEPCQFATSHEGVCEAIDAQTFQIKFTEDNQNLKVTGQTIGKPFQNPYSARQFDSVQSKYYIGCDIGLEAAVAGKTTIAAFQQDVIRESAISLTSTSQKLAVTNAILSVSFTPKSILPQQGIVSIQAPSWYIVSEQRQPQQYSSESMLSFDSEGFFESHAGEGFEVLSTNYDASSSSLTMVYSGTRLISNSEELVFRISNFKNPVNKEVKKGFRLTTQDSQGYLVDQSETNLQLDTKMDIVGRLVQKEILLLGDSSGLNIGRVFEYNKITLFFSSYIPFEQFCYFKFVFPDKLKIDENLQIITGEGIFAPDLFGGDGQLPSTSFRIDTDRNTVHIEGCTQPEFLSSRPFGSIGFSYVLLPDYISDQDPVELYAYSDNAYLDLVFEESKANGGGLFITREMLQPGHLELIDFVPSNYYAFVEDVTYTISIKPSHDMHTSTRIVLTMPENLKFDQQKGCTIKNYVDTNCALVPGTNEMLLTNIFNQRVAGGTSLKFIISTGDNPIGARDAGKWGARTESLFSKEYHIVDGNQDGESFFALAGFIKSKLSYSATMTFTSDSTLNFQLETEHNVPKGGTLKLLLPVEMEFPKAEQLIFSGDGLLWEATEELTSRQIVFKFDKAHTTNANPIKLTLQNIRMPRSYRPSSEFVVETRSLEDFVIDAGGSDITVTMSEMNTLNSLSIQAASLINGDVTDYTIGLQSLVNLKDGDRIMLEIPPTVGFGPGGISCDPSQPDQVGVTKVSCDRIDQNHFYVAFDQVQYQTGQFELIVHGMKNPRTFRKSALFQDIYFQTYDYYNIQKLEDYDSLWIQTNEVAQITDFQIQQTTSLYGVDAIYTITFQPKNPISKNGVISITWTDDVEFPLEDKEENERSCDIFTYKQFNQQCVFDDQKRNIRVANTFTEQDQFNAQITIILSKIQNPRTNKNLKYFSIETFDDTTEEFPIDILRVQPVSECTYPCMRCSADKNYCYSCWQDELERFLMTTETFSKCQGQCDDGWTTDGNEQKVCQRCEASCKTCLDNGVFGDKAQCKECAEGFGLTLGKQCVQQCPMGTYQSGTRCLQCHSSCQTCDGAGSSSCTSCDSQSSLFDKKCGTGCPSGYGRVGSVCFQCQFPCSECSTGPEMCTACSQDDGKAFLFGPTCVQECPKGFNTNLDENKCEGCGAGCEQCDAEDQRICTQCRRGLMMHEYDCVSDCPKGFLADYDAKNCYPLSDLDISLIPFPCLIITLTFFILSYVGKRQKPKHLVIPNFLVIMGLLEHGMLISQIILNFKYGTWRYGIFLILAWICFVVTNIVWIFVHFNKVTKKDKKYQRWRNQPHNKCARRIMNVVGLLGSWKVYKLCYSSSWGIKLTAAQFGNRKVYRQLQKRFLWVNILSVYAVVILVNCVGLWDLDWGTQLYIQMLENVIIFVMVTWAGLWEQKKQETDYLADRQYGGMRGKMNVMSALCDEDLPEITKTREHLLSQADVSKLTFIERKFDELVELFGNRHAKSFYDLNREKTADPRAVKTWPSSPRDAGPVEPLPDPYPDNCYTQGLTEDQMAQMKFLSKKHPSKAIQSDNFDADQNLRRDAFLIGHKRDLAELERSVEKKKVRGRKNRYFKQIDHEDHEAGVLLDDDDEGQRENLKARNELLDAEASLEAARQDENKKLLAVETRQKAMMLTEENLRLKKLLEEQRIIDARDQKDYQNRILEEEKRRQEILASIEAARRVREAKHQQAQRDLEAEKEARIAEIERMQQEHLNKNQGQSEQQRREAEAEFNAEKARLESEFNEKLIQSQREAAPSAAPGKLGSKQEVARSPQAVRLVPSGVVKEEPRPVAVTPQPIMEEAVVASPKKSVKSVASSHASPQATMRMSALQTADDASGFDNSFVQPAESDTERREFNEIDILGSLDRDDKGNVIVPTDEKTGSKRSFDKDGRPINHYGHLIDSETGDVIHNTTGERVFARKDLDERGNIPMPHSLERFNFNPFDLLGTFFYDDVEDPLSFQKSQRGGRYIDELGRFVSLQGFLADADGSVVTRDGVKRFDWRQFRQFGGLMPKLYNYYGKTFELQEVMGVFDRDSQGAIQLLLGRDDAGKDVYVDKAGFMVNQRGYIVTRDGHICTREGKVLFLKAQLKSGEFPKIFPFTRFNINRVLGDVEMDPGGQPLLGRNARGQQVDRQGRQVTGKGFLADWKGNVIDVRGKLVFEKALLEHNGDIPEIFRSNILRSDSQSSLSRFMSEIDREQRFDESGVLKNPSNLPRHAAASDTSFESMMEDSPSKYDRQNMRFSQSNPDVFGNGAAPKSARWAGTIPDNIMEEMSEYEAGYEPERKRKRVKGKGYVIEQVTQKDVQMASAYGGVAKPRIRKTAPRFSTVARIDRTGLQTSQAPTRPSGPRMQNLTGQVNKFESQDRLLASRKSDKPTETDGVGGRSTRAGVTTQRTGNTFDASKTGFRVDNTAWGDQHRDSSMLDVSQDEAADDAAIVSNLRNKRSAAQKKRSRAGKPKVEVSKITPNALQMPKYDRAFEEEFEKVYKKDIDKFIDGSDFEVESLAGFSEISKGTFKSAVQNNPRMKGLEKVYLQRLEFQQIGAKTKKYRPKPQVKREFLDRFCDDPRYIAKGERLGFDHLNGTQTGSSGKKKPPTPAYLEPQQQRSQSSLLGQDVGMVHTTGHMRPTKTPENFKIAQQDSAYSHQSQTRQPSRQNPR